jgi:hypothetical protein
MMEVLLKSRTNMTSTEQAFQGLLSNQMVAFAAHMASQFPNLDQGRVILLEAAAAISKGNRSSTKRMGTPSTRLVLPQEDRCMARVWRSGSGRDQCSKFRADGDYCKSHAKESAIGERAIQVHPDSFDLAHVPGTDRVGLWTGRIDEFQDGEDGVPPYKDRDGIIRIQWTSEDMKARVAAEVDAGTARFADGGKRKERKTKSSRPSNTNTSITGLLEKELVVGSETVVVSKPNSSRQATCWTWV